MTLFFSTESILLLGLPGAGDQYGSALPEVEYFRISGEFVGQARGEISARKRLFIDLKVGKSAYFSINYKSIGKKYP